MNAENGNKAARETATVSELVCGKIIEALAGIRYGERIVFTRAEISF